MGVGPDPKPRAKRQKLDQWVASLPSLFVSQNAITKDVYQAVERRLLRKIGPRLYAKDVSTPIDQLVLRNAIPIAALKFPSYVLSHRTALEMRPEQGHLFLTGPRGDTLKLDGLTIKVKKGPGAVDDDMDVMGLFRSSDARAYLENFDYSRRSRGISRVLHREELERRLELYLQKEGEAGLNRLRDRAKQIAPSLGFDKGLADLVDVIGALLKTRSIELTAPIAIARSTGVPFDEAATNRFELLAEHLLENWSAISRPRDTFLRHEVQNLAFIDAYFSNYIEGTIFAVDEARDIIFHNKVPKNRPKDAHDIGGTFQILMDRTEMSISASDFDDVDQLCRTLEHHHRVLMGARPQLQPGKFKTIANQAGNTMFVQPELVLGTLARGLDTLKTLATPFQRAAFVMFMLLEVHPFNDGNGRIARIMMNAELASAQQSPILIVTSYREDYVLALRKLSRSDEPRTYVRMLDRAHQFASRLPYDDLEGLIALLKECNAFDDSGGIMKMPPARP